MRVGEHGMGVPGVLGDDIGVSAVVGLGVYTNDEQTAGEEGVGSTA